MVKNNFLLLEIRSGSLTSFWPRSVSSTATSACPSVYEDLSTTGTDSRL